MSYTITHANGTNPIVIADGTVDTSTSITLVGKNTPSYGQYLDQNFLNILESFANSSSPSNPIAGQIWYDTTHSLLKVYNGTAFKNVSNASSSASSPSGASIGDFWFDTINQQLNVYNGTSWVVIGPASAGTVVSESIADTGAIQHSVISFKIGTSRYAILSKDAQFTPASGINGFSTINPGFNIVNTAFVPNNRFVGTATNSDALGSVLATSFMRSDQNTSTSGILSVTNNSGINVGTTGQGSFNVTSNEVHIDNTQSNGLIRLRTKTAGGSIADALDILGNADVQINGNLFVLGNLDVTNSAETSIVSGTGTSTSTTTGAFQVVGGVGIGGNINVGGTNNTFSGNVVVANLQTSGNVYANYINAGVIGNSGASLVGTVSTAAQPQITSLGTLTGLQVSGTAGFTGGAVTFNPTSSYKLALGNVGNVQISGGSSGQVLQTDGTGNMVWYSVPVGGGASAGQLGVFANSTTIVGNAGVTYTGNLNITGNILATQDIVAYYSDQRLKTDIAPITNALEKINKINGVTYHTNDIAAALGVGDNREHVGVLAQEVQAVLPQVIHSAPFDLDENGVSKSGEHYLTVQYDKIIPLLIQAIKELSAEVEALKARGS